MADAVINECRNIFITGVADTGKSYLLMFLIRDLSEKAQVVVTEVAADIIGP